MDQLWEQYLSSLFPLNTIRELVVYTDSYRYWLAASLLDLAEDLDWQVSLQLIEEITDEEGMEIRQSLGFLGEQTLLVSMFSNRNPIIEELNSIFPLLSSPIGFDGYHLTTQQNIPDQYFPGLLEVDIFAAKGREAELREEIGDTVTITSENGTYLEGDVKGLAAYPYHAESKHIVLPSTEFIINLIPQTVDGTVAVTEGIGEYRERDELVDPFGKVDSQIDLLFEDGNLVDIRGSGPLTRRLENIVSLPFHPDEIQLSIGLGLHQSTSGFIEIDRLLDNYVTLSCYSDTTDSYLEFVMSDIEF